MMSGPSSTWSTNDAVGHDAAEDGLAFVIQVGAAFDGSFAVLGARASA